ncbi:MAG: FxsA family protein [Actinomycetota bacterium]
MAWLVVLALVAFPVIEISLFVQSVQAFGALPTLAAAILAGVVGLKLLRRQGLALLLGMRAQFERGEPPVAEAFDALCLAAAGLLLLLPGFFSDFLALLLLLPPVRALLGRWLAARVLVRHAGPARGPAVIDGDWHEVPPAASGKLPSGTVVPPTDP